MFSFHDPRLAIVLIVCVSVFLFYQQRLLQSQVTALRSFLTRLGPEKLTQTVTPTTPNQQVENLPSQVIEQMSCNAEDFFDDDSVVEDRYNKMK